MIGSRSRTLRTVLALFAFTSVLCAPLVALSQEAEEHDLIAKLKQLVGYPDNERNSRPLYEEIAELKANGEYSSEDVQNGAVLPQFREIAKCGVYEPPPLEQHFTLRDGALVGNADLSSSSIQSIPAIHWIRGLKARLEQIEPGKDSAERSREEIRQALDTLPPRQKITALLHDVEGYSKPEIAQILECPEATVRSNLHIARTKLKRILKKRLS